jgi:hypothetical protein
MEVTGVQWNQLAELTNYVLETGVEQIEVDWPTVKVKISTDGTGFTLEVDSKV